MNNFWRHLRLAGIVLMCAGSWMSNVQLIMYGAFTLLIGIVEGLINIECRLEILERENTNEDERPH